MVREATAAEVLAHLRLLRLENWLRQRLFGLELEAVRGLYARTAVGAEPIRQAILAAFAQAGPDGRWQLTDSGARARNDRLLSDLDDGAARILQTTEPFLRRQAERAYRAGYYGRAWVMANLTTPESLRYGPIPTEAIDAAINAPYEGSSWFMRFGDARADFIRRMRRAVATSQAQGDPIRTAMQRLSQELGWDLEKLPATYRGGPKLVRLRGLTAQLERIARTECLAGSSRVDAAVVTAAYRRWYKGDVIDVSVADGGELSVTPNHPMLTTSGWVAAGELHEGDDLIGYHFGKDPRSSGYEDIGAAPPTITQVFDSLSAVGIAERVRTSEPDFHGDGRKGEVDILRPFWPLRIGRFSPFYQPVIQPFLAPSDQARAVFCRECGRLLPLDQQPCLCWGAPWDAHLSEAAIDYRAGDTHASANALGRFARAVARRDGFTGDVASVVGGVIAPGIERGPRVTQGTCAIGSHEPAMDRAGISPDLQRNRGRAQAGSVKLQRVVSLSRRVYVGHVYNLSTPYGYFSTPAGYTGNTIRTSNMGMEAVMQANADVLRGWEWITSKDKRTDWACAKLDGRVFALGSGQHRPPLHPMCIPGDTLVTTVGRIAAATERWYEGEVLVISTASGNKLTVTPNHPILTDRGWMAPKLLEPGGRVVRYPGSAEGRPADPDYEQMPAMIEQVARALRGSGGMVVTRVPVAPEDFHGDGGDGEVEIVWSDGILRHDLCAQHTQRIRDLDLVGAHALAEPHSRGSPLQAVPRPPTAAASGVSGGDLARALLSRHLRPLEPLGRLLTPWHDAAGEQPPPDGRPAEPELVRYLFLRYSGQIQLDEVVQVDVRAFHGLVYNLETESGWYTGNSIIVHNCRCSQAPAVLNPSYGPRETYSQWAEKQAVRPDQDGGLAGTKPAKAPQARGPA